MKYIIRIFVLSLVVQSNLESQSQCGEIPGHTYDRKITASTWTWKFDESTFYGASYADESEMTVEQVRDFIEYAVGLWTGAVNQANTVLTMSETTGSADLTIVFENLEEGLCGYTPWEGLLQIGRVQFQGPTDLQCTILHEMGHVLLGTGHYGGGIMRSESCGEKIVSLSCEERYTALNQYNPIQYTLIVKNDFAGAIVGGNIVVNGITNANIPVTGKEFSWRQYSPIETIAAIDNQSIASGGVSYTRQYRDWNDVFRLEVMVSRPNLSFSPPSRGATYSARFLKLFDVSFTSPLYYEYGGSGAYYTVEGNQSTFTQIAQDSSKTVAAVAPSGRFFQQWSINDANKNQSPRSLTPNDHLSLSATFKMRRGSSIATATGSAGQRKLYYAYGPQSTWYWHLVYESAGEVWYLRSADGTTWTDEIRLSRGAGTAHNPAIGEMRDPTYDRGLYVAWLDNTARSGASGYDVLVKRLDLSTGQWSSEEPIMHPDTPTGSGYARSDARPVVVSYIENYDNPRVVVAYEGAGTGIRYSYKIWSESYQEFIWLTSTVPNTSSYSVQPSMTLAWNAQSQPYLALTCDDSYAVCLSKSTALTGFTMSFGTPENVPANGVMENRRLSTVAADGSGRVHVSFLAWDIDYEKDVVLHRSKDINNNWSGLYEFVDDLVDPPVMNASVAGEELGAGASMLISDSRNVINLAASNGTSWDVNNYTYYGGTPIDHPNAAVKTTDWQLQSVLSKNASAPFQVLFEERDNSPEVPKRAVDPNRFEPSVRTVYGLATHDSATGALLIVEMENVTFTNNGKQIAVSLPTKVGSGSVQTETFTLENNGDLSVDLSLKLIGEKAPARPVLELLSDVDHSVLSTFWDLPEPTSNERIAQRIIRTMSKTSHACYLRLKMSGQSESADAEPYTRVHVGPAETLDKGGSRIESISKTILPSAFGLEQNYPNPFNPTTEIRYSLKEPATVRLEVFNMIGERVALLVDGYQSAGYHAMTWDATHMPTGTFLCRLSLTTPTGESYQSSRRLVVMR